MDLVRKVKNCLIEMEDRALKISRQYAIVFDTIDKVLEKEIEICSFERIGGSYPFVCEELLTTTLEAFGVYCMEKIPKVGSRYEFIIRCEYKGLQLLITKSKDNFCPISFFVGEHYLSTQTIHTEEELDTIYSKVIFKSMDNALDLIGDRVEMTNFYEARTNLKSEDVITYILKCLTRENYDIILKSKIGKVNTTLVKFKGLTFKKIILQISVETNDSYLEENLITLSAKYIDPQ